MKHNWEYKPVCEIFETVTDFVAAGSFADLRDNVIYNSEKDFAQLIRTTDLKNKFSNQQFVYVNEHAFNYLWRVNLSEECIILPNIGNCGEVYYLHPSMLIYPNNVLGPNAIMVRSKCHNQKYLAFALKGSNFQQQLSQIVSQVAQSKFNKTNLKKLLLPIPPMEVQQQIVAELDKINEVIEDCRELLRNLDALAQSLFYGYFGDPVTNPKNWEVIKLDSLIQPKKNILRASKKFTQNDFITYIDISSINRNSNSISGPSVLEFGDAPSRAQQCVKHGDLLVSWVRPNLKNIALCRITSNSLVASSGFCILRSNKTSNSAYLLYLFLAESTTEYLCSKISGAAYPAITENDIREMLVPVPPLPLQQKFAARIEQIEAQKKAVEQTIAELQTLLDSRMDYWFN